MAMEDKKEFYDWATITRMSELCSDVGYAYAIGKLDTLIKYRKDKAMDTLHPIIAAALRPFVEPSVQSVRDAIIDDDYYLVNVRKNLIVEHLGALSGLVRSYETSIDQAVVSGLTAKIHGWCNK